LFVDELGIASNAFPLDFSSHQSSNPWFCGMRIQDLRETKTCDIFFLKCPSPQTVKILETVIMRLFDRTGVQVERAANPFLERIVVGVDHLAETEPVGQFIVAPSLLARVDIEGNNLPVLGHVRLHKPMEEERVPLYRFHSHPPRFVESETFPHGGTALPIHTEKRDRLALLISALADDLSAIGKEDSPNGAASSVCPKGLVFVDPE
jgi:hypothetical protein